MLLSVAYFIKVAIVSATGLFLVGVLAALTVTFAKYLKAQVSTSATVQIESAKIGDDDVSGYLATRAKELASGVRLDALYEVKVPPLAENFGSGDRFKLPEDLKIEFQGVNVQTVVNSILSILPDDRYRITAEPAKGMPTSVLRLEWKPPTGKARTWLLRSEPSEAEAANERMIDRVISTLAYHMYYDPEGPKEWRTDPRMAAALKELAFPDARALEAFFVGQQHLNAYLRAPQNSNPLTAAETEFRRLQKEMPEFPDGLMLLGVTLSEQRNEADAVTVYERAIQALQQQITKLEADLGELGKAAGRDAKTAAKLKGTIEAKTAAKTAARKTLFQAQLFQANAYRKLYRWDDLVRAVTLLDDIDKALDDIAKAPPPELTDRDKMEFRKIHAVASSEKANSIGYGLILLHHDTFIDALKNLTAPPTLALTKERRDILQALAEDSARLREGDPGFKEFIDRRNKAFKSELDILFKKQNAALTQARDELKEITKIAAPDGGADKDAWDREARRIESLLLSAEGYGMFRRAQLDETDPQKGDADFIRDCEAALAKLQEADAQQPNQYVVLQDIGMIYGEARFDADNRKIGTARRYFEDSIKIKPDDYYGHQSLASLAVRQAYAWGIELADDELIKDGINHVTQSRKQRPDNGTAFVVLSQLYALRWAKDADDKKKSEGLFQASLANARKVRANPVRIWVSQLQWRLLQVREASPDESTDQASEAGQADPNAEKEKKDKKGLQVRGASPDESADQAGKAGHADPNAEKEKKDKKGTFKFEKDAFMSDLDRAIRDASNIPGWEAQQLVLVARDLLEKVKPLPARERDTLNWPSSPFRLAP